MVGRLLSFWVSAYFQGRLLLFSRRGIWLVLNHPPPCCNPNCSDQPRLRNMVFAQHKKRILPSGHAWEVDKLTFLFFHRENTGTLGWYPSCLSSPRSPLKGDISNKYPLYLVYMGLIIKGTIPRVPPFSLWFLAPEPLQTSNMHFFWNEQREKPPEGFALSGFHNQEVPSVNFFKLQQAHSENCCSYQIIAVTIIVAVLVCCLLHFFFFLLLSSSLPFLSFVIVSLPMSCFFPHNCQGAVRESDFHQDPRWVYPQHILPHSPQAALASDSPRFVC